MTAARTVVVLGSALVLASCSSGSHHAGTTSTPTSTSASTTDAKQLTAQSLERSARAALDANHKLSVFVLWNNTIPAWASRSTGGPALAALRSAAATRRTRGIRARLLSDRRRILSFRLDPSYTKATAVIVDRQRVQPNGRNGRPLGRVVVLNERATYELRRVGQTGRFLVWRVVLSR